MQECARKLPHVDILQGYGMTETCSVISTSTGVFFPCLQSKILSVDTSQPLPPNQIGEIRIRGPSIMQGYLNNPEATKSTIDKQGWLHTSDLGYFNDEGELFVVNRIKELIKYKGFQVAPAEVEGLLLSHPEIIDAAVIPYPDAEAGEVPIAFIVRSLNRVLSEENVTESYICKECQNQHQERF